MDYWLRCMLPFHKPVPATNGGANDWKARLLWHVYSCDAVQQIGIYLKNWNTPSAWINPFFYEGQNCWIKRKNWVRQLQLFSYSPHNPWRHRCGASPPQDRQRSALCPSPGQPSPVWGDFGSANYSDKQPWHLYNLIGPAPRGIAYRNNLQKCVDQEG